MDDDDVTEAKLYGTFEKHDEFRAAQKSLLEVDLAREPTTEEDQHEASLLRKLGYILGEYQEQAYLLDPYLDSLVTTVVEKLKAHARSFAVHRGYSWSLPRIGRLAQLLYNYIRCRGYKTIIRFFPHEIADLSITLDYMLASGGPCQQSSQWPLRYIVLLWLSLICMIPFDLDQFDEPEHVGKTAGDIASLGQGFLGKAGLERDGAAMLLSRLYIRKDTRSSFDDFLNRCRAELQGAIDVFLAIGLLQVLCEVVKSGPMEQIHPMILHILEIQKIIESNPALTSNTLVRKYKVKLVSRLALRILPPRARATRKARPLTGEPMPSNQLEDNDIEVPEVVEVILEDIFQALQDRDTVVRWSAAKGVARISERLPPEYADQVLDTIMALFAIHSVAAASMYDMPAVAESTWHGSCLACAEMARRGMVSSGNLPKLIGWMEKALYFDIRKGAHSIGANVRDAAGYVLWALARAQDATALAPHANNLARRLVTVALYDREIHIRRAASAAFQEHVGRMNLMPHGIDVLRKIDFYAVSVRRHSFLIAAAEVAEHSEYRESQFSHLLDITQRHWDASMRELGAQSLRLICETDLPYLGPKGVERAINLLDSIDVTDLHGALLALTELASAFKEAGPKGEYESQRLLIFNSLTRIPLQVLKAPRNELVTAAACQLVANSISLAELRLEVADPMPCWRQVLEVGLHHRSRTVQAAAASAMASISKLIDCTSLGINRHLTLKLLHTLRKELASGSSAMQQSLGQFLGSLDYTLFSHDLDNTVHALLGFVRPSPSRLANLEARQNCFAAIPQIISTLAPQIQERLPPEIVCDLYNSLLEGLNDYTIDERGDVGSWIRITCIKGLVSISSDLFMYAAKLPNLSEYLPPSQYHRVVGGILKQGVERLDSVRQEAGENFLRLLQISLTPSLKSWRIHGDDLMKRLFLGESEITGWHDGDWLFPKAVQLLEVEQYRKPLLYGFILSLSSRTDSTQRPVAASLVSYARSLPAKSSGTGYTLPSLVNDLLDRARSQMSSNTTVIPVLQTFNVLLEGDVLGRLSEDAEGIACLRSLFWISTQQVPRLKNVQRIHESMKILINLLPFRCTFTDCLRSIDLFLVHAFPKIRSDTAEYLYLVLQSKDIGNHTDEAEDVLLETEWSSDDISVAREAAKAFVDKVLIEDENCE